MVSSAFKKQGKPVVLIPLGSDIHAGHRSLLRAAKRIPGAVTLVVATSSALTPVLQEERIDAFAVLDDATLFPHGLRTQLVVPDRGMESPATLAKDLTRLLSLCTSLSPTDLILGEKDYELLILAQHMIVDLHLPVKIHAVQTVRLADGLALSLRNANLDETARNRAYVLSAALAAGVHAGQRGVHAIKETIAEVLAAENVQPAYIKILQPNLEPLGNDPEARILLAADFQGVHLFDNAPVLLPESAPTSINASR